MVGLSNVVENQPKVLKWLYKFVGEAIPRWNRQINGKYSGDHFLVQCTILIDRVYKKAYMNICSDIQGVVMGSAKANCLDGDACKLRVIHLDRVERARRDTVTEKELNWLSSIYKVLGDPSRLKIVMALRNVEMCVCDLAAFLGLTESAISHQLRRLKDLALVKSRREGQVIYYSLDDAHVAELLNVGLEHVTE
jgi:DNA-binding transcriptional ArsR family regulator